jgi:putative ABC transport system permease protein
MWQELLRQAWSALRRQPTRSFLTMLGMVWGITAVTLLIAYGNSFRSILVHAFQAFGKGAVICWPQTTSEQAGGERAGKHVVFEQEDVELIRAQATLVRSACLETVRWLPIAYGEHLYGREEAIDALSNTGISVFQMDLVSKNVLANLALSLFGIRYIA